jgi:hypothetical protein
VAHGQFSICYHVAKDPILTGSVHMWTTGRPLLCSSPVIFRRHLLVSRSCPMSQSVITVVEVGDVFAARHLFRSTEPVGFGGVVAEV